MSKTFIPAGYEPKLSLYETQAAISLIKRTFQDHLAQALNLKRVSAPLFVEPSTGLNDDLNGVERPVSFDIPAAGMDAQVVQSLAKWKRMALYRYDFHPGKGIYTDMNAIRRDEELDNLHSVYVDQWDWERVITPETRNLNTLKDAVREIVGCISDASLIVNGRYPKLHTQLGREGASGSLSRQESQGAGVSFRAGAPHHLPDGHRRQAVQRSTPRRPRPRL